MFDWIRKIIDGLFPKPVLKPVTVKIMDVPTKALDIRPSNRTIRYIDEKFLDIDPDQYWDDNIS